MSEGTDDHFVRRTAKELRDVQTAGLPASQRRLIVAGVASFAEGGFAATTTRQIGVRAAMSAAGLYVYYPTKEELLFHICELGHLSVLGAMESALEIMEPESSSAGRLRQLMCAYTLWHAEHATFARVVQYELRALSDGHFTQIARIRKRTEETFRTTITRGLESGEFETVNLESTLLALFSLGIDVARWYRPHRRIKPDVLADNYADLAIAMLQRHGPHRSDGHDDRADVGPTRTSDA